MTTLLGPGGFKPEQTKQEISKRRTCIYLVVYIHHSVCIHCFSLSILMIHRVGRSSSPCVTEEQAEAWWPDSDRTLNSFISSFLHFLILFYYPRFYIFINPFPDDGTLKCSEQACLSHILAVSPVVPKAMQAPLTLNDIGLLSNRQDLASSNRFQLSAL